MEERPDGGAPGGASVNVLKRMPFMTTGIKMAEWKLETKVFPSGCVACAGGRLGFVEWIVQQESSAIAIDPQSCIISAQQSEVLGGTMQARPGSAADSSRSANMSHAHCLYTDTV